MLSTYFQVHSDLDPLDAPEWSIEVSLLDRPDCLLAKHIDKHYQLCSDTRTVKMLLGELVDNDNDNSEKVSQALDKMTGSASGYNLGNLQDIVRPLSSRRSPTGGPLRPGLVKHVLSYLFPDSDGVNGPELSSAILAKLKFGISVRCIGVLFLFKSLD